MARVYEGTILTVDEYDSVARFLVEERGRITYVGKNLPERYGRCERIELGDCALCPSFADTHVHLSGYALHLAGYGQDASAQGGQAAQGTPSVTELAGMVQHAVDVMASRGIGMVQTAAGVGASNGMDISFERWMAKSIQNGFQIRVFPQSMDIIAATRRRLPRIGGCFANALDGHFESRDAALLQPYVGSDESGTLRYSDEQLERFCCDAHRSNLQIQLHAMGDAAFDQAVRALKKATEYWPRSDCRYRILHACLPTPDGLRECAELDFNLAMQMHYVDPATFDVAVGESLGEERASRLCPLRTIWDAGVLVSAGSDAPLADPDPIAWMHAACNHRVPEQSLSPKEALRMCTYNGYWASFNDDERGSLEAGKIADMCILSGDPYSVGASNIGNLRVEHLILGGKPYVNQKQGAMSAIAMGLFGMGYC